MVRGLIFCFFLGGLTACAQSTPPPTWENTPILRLQHQDFGSNACVLLRRNGDFHLEQERRRTTVYEGSLTREQLAEVNRWLADPALVRFSQNDVVVPLISRRDDQMQINVLRMDHWQFLEFPDAESRKLLETSLGPLLAWLKDLHNLPSRTLSEEEGKNNCLPPGQIELKHRPAQPDATSEKNSAAAARPAPDATVQLQISYLLRFEVDRYGAGTAERMCMVVYPNGLYHAEKASQNLRSEMNSDVYEAHLEPAAISALRELLDEPSLKTAQQGNLPPDAGSSEITILRIPRGESTQSLRFAENFAVWQGQRQNIVSHDPGAKVAEPVENWVKMEFHPAKSARVKHAAANNCAPR